MRLTAEALLPLVLCGATLTGCRGYADFRLPAPSGSTVRTVPWVESRPDPVIDRGQPGDWDSSDVLNPAVVRKGGLYYNFYSGFDGKIWHTGLAISANGTMWTKRGKILSPDPATWEGSYIAANGTAVWDGQQFLYWYQGGAPVASIGLATSPDGQHWRKEPSPVLGPGPRGSWDERGAADPSVLRVGDTYYLFYLGTDRARRQRLGVARSKNGVRWERLRSNPILELGERGSFDERGLGEPAVWAAHGVYWMLYTGRDRQERRAIGLAQSRDGVTWQRVRTEPIFRGDADWNREVVCDPSVEVAGDDVRAWYGGGDVRSPDERLHGQIGLFSLRWSGDRP